MSLHRKALLALFFALVANVSGQAFLFVTLPALGRRMGFSDIATGAILSVSALLLIVGAPMWGYVSERIGRRPVILTALAGTGFGAVAYGLVTKGRMEDALGMTLAFGLFFAARIIQAMFVGGLLPSVQAYVADITTADQRVSGMGLIGAAYGLGGIGGAALAWWAGGSDPAAGFWLSAAFVATGLVLILLLAPEPPRVRRAAEVSRLPLGRIWPFAAITLITYSSYGIAQQVMALRLQDVLGFSVAESIAKAGVGLLVTALAMVIVQGVVVRLISWRPERLLATGAALAATSMLLCGLAPSYEQILGVMVIFGVSLGLLVPGNLASLSVRTSADAQGKAAGFNMMGQGVGLALGPITGASLHQISPFAPFAAATILFLLATGLAVRVWLSEKTPAMQEAL